MGYSCTAIAGMAARRLEKMLNEAGPPPNGSSNTWRAADGMLYFFERGREQADGAVTGSVYRMVGPMAGDDPGTFRARKIGSVRVAPNGQIVRWPTASAEYRRAAQLWAEAEFCRVYGPAAR
jgi:hypothetical protein